MGNKRKVRHHSKNAHLILPIVSDANGNEIPQQDCECSEDQAEAPVAVKEDDLMEVPKQEAQTQLMNSVEVLKAEMKEEEKKTTEVVAKDEEEKAP